MKIGLTKALLKRVCRILEHNPLWAILILNEYLEEVSPIRKAFVVKARRVLEYTSYGEEAMLYADQIMSGKKLSELPAFLKNILQAKKHYALRDKSVYIHNRQILRHRAGEYTIEHYNKRELERRL